ncbi:MAG: xanthine dehydrogenase small subunit [Kiritimatiellia bacterium]|jgi:xanthine dehydrogenase small subunit
MQSIRFTLNDEPVEVTGLSPNLTLLQWLRDHAHLTGTKEGCAEGDCGACTVVVLDADGGRYRAINACLILVPMMHGQTVYTIEGLRTRGPKRSEDKLHPAQQAIIDELGSQCGFCTPGVVMSLFEATYRTDLGASPGRLRDQLCGNLCRCTGYRPIHDAAARVAGTCPDDRFSKLLEKKSLEHKAPDGAKSASVALSYASDDHTWSAPTSLTALWKAMADHPGARLVCGSTDLSLGITRRFEQLPTLISVRALPELQVLDLDGDEFRIGAAVTLAQVEEQAQDALPMLCRMLRYFASRQIKNVGTVGGNVCNASPIGDTPPALLALGASVELASARGVRRVALHEFFLAYRQTAMKADEVMTAILVPKPAADARMGAYKVSKRRELDISTVCAAFYVQVDPANVVTSARCAWGGMAAVPSRAKNVENALVGKPWTEESVDAAAELLDDAFTPLDDLRSSAWYRMTVAKNLLRGFWRETQLDPVPRLPDEHTSTLLSEVP